METLYRKTFLSWDEEGYTIEHGKVKTRAIALCDGTWFLAAINALRDGDMGKMDGNGVFERIWWGDDIYNADVKNVRPATLSEVELYLKYCKLEDEAREEGREIVAIVYGQDQTDVIFKSAARK